MGGNTSNLRFIVLLVLVLSLFSAFVSATCIKIAANTVTCTPGGSVPSCQNIGATYDSRDILDVPICKEGCCCNAATSYGFKTNGTCDYISGASLKPGSITNDSIKNYPLGADNACSAICDIPSKPLLSQCSNTNCGSDVSSCICGNRAVPSGSNYCCSSSNYFSSSQSVCLAQCTTLPGSKSVSGHVYKKGTVNEPVAGVEVSIPGSSPVISGADGSFTILDVAVLIGNATASKSGYVSAKNEYDVSVSSNNNFNIFITKIVLVENCTMTLIDTDLDGCIAKYDSDCTGFINENSQNKCNNNNIDDDCNGDADCDDSSCENVASNCLPGATTYCGDGLITNPNTFGINESCDGTSMGSCDNATRICSNDCKTCIDISSPHCGNGVKESIFKEECDFNDTTHEGCALPNRCTNQCTCQAVNTCNNNVLDSPKEECEFDSSQTSLITGSLCAFDECIKEREAGECLCATRNLCGNNIYDESAGRCDNETLGPKGVYGCFNSDGVTNNASLCDVKTCTCLTCNEDQKTPVLNLTELPGQAILLWNTSCNFSAPTYTLKRCEMSGSDCIPNVSISFTGTGKIDNIASKNYCYRVFASYPSIFENYASDIRCTNYSASMSTCKSGNTICDGNAIKICNSAGIFEDFSIGGEPQNCSLKGLGNVNTYTCIQKNISGNTQARCVFQSECEKCNSWFSMFSNADIKITNGVVNTPCSVLESCYLDYTLSSVDKYYSCSEQKLKSCYDYKSEYACNENKCGVPECEWMNLTESQELGIGVCRPEKVEDQNCNNCGDYSLNNFFGACTKEYCNLFGKECYFIDSKGSEISPSGSECFNKYQMSCEGYNNKNDCIGNVLGVNSSMHIFWNNPLNDFSYAGSNNHSVKSRDYLNFSYCVWDGSSCFKDGNGDFSKDCNSASNLNKDSCRQDFTPPQSYISFSNPQKQRLNLEVGLIEEESNNTFIHFNIVKRDSGIPCYPNSTKYNLIFTKAFLYGNKTGVINNMVDDADPNLNDNNYTLCYFGEDKNKNFEEVNFKDLVVDAKIPGLNFTYSNVSFSIPNNNPVYDGEDEIYLSNVTLNVSIDEHAYCTFLLNLTTDIGSKQIGRMTLTDLNASVIYSANYSNLQDGTYFYSVNCKDTAGNINLTNFNFTLNADNHIVNLSPDTTFGPNNMTSDKLYVNISAETSSEAVCRYDYIQKNFSEMQFNMNFSLDKKQHSKIIEFPNTEYSLKALMLKTVNYYVKCNFTNQNKIYGNDGDKIAFALDFVPPNISFEKDGVPFTFKPHNEWYRLSELENLKIKCIDSPILYNGKDYSSGCKELHYKIQKANETASTLIAGSGDVEADLNFPSENNIYALYYYSVDNLGNNNSINDQIVNIDSQNFSFKFSILDNKKKIPATTITLDKNYTVTMVSTKIIPNYTIFPEGSSYNINIKEVGFTIGSSSEKYYFNEPYYILDSDGVTMIWQTKLRLNQDFINLDSDAKFFILAEDIHGIISDDIMMGEEFSINTNKLELPKIDPEFENGGNSYEVYYADRFHEDNGTYYTNDKNLYVTGSSNDRGTISYFLNHNYTLFSNYSLSQNANNSPKNSFDLDSDSLKGSNQLSFGLNLEDLENFYVKTPDKRVDYTHFREYYNISDIIVNDESIIVSNVMLTSILENSIGRGEMIEFYDKSHPYDWFGMSLNLNEGENTFFALLTDDLGNDVKTINYKLFFDNSSPVYLNHYPKDFSKLGSSNNSITLEFTEEGSGIDESSLYVLLEINGTLEVDISNHINISVISQNDVGNGISAYTYRLSYPINTLNSENGNYKVYFDLMDKSRNKYLRNWSFSIDANAPSDPEIKFNGIPNTSIVNNITYMKNASNGFTLNYSDIGNVTIKMIDLYVFNFIDDETFPSGPTKQNISTCTRIGNDNLFNCLFNNNSDVFAEEQYSIRIDASKKGDDNKTHTSSYFEFFVVDRTPPNYTLIYDNTTNSNANMTFRTIVTSDDKFLKANLTFNEITEELQFIRSGPVSEYLYSQSFNFFWPVGDEVSGIYPFNFSLSDYAQNTDSKTKFILINNEMPEIKILNFSVTNKFERNKNPHNFTNLTEFEEKLKNNPKYDEDVRFKGNSLELLGEIMPNPSYGYFIKNISVTKRNSDGTLIGGIGDSDTIKKINICHTIFKDCMAIGNSSTPNYGKFNLKDYDLTLADPNSEKVYYLLFQVEDESENIKYFTLQLVSDQKAPEAPDINIIDIK